MQRFKDKFVLITASSTGIGLAIAYRIAQEGGTVLISSRSEEHINKAVSQITSAGETLNNFFYFFKVIKLLVSLVM